MENSNNIRIIRHCLEHIIDYMNEHREMFVVNPKADFVRNKKVKFEDVIKIILSMKGESLDKEIYDYFSGDYESVFGASAFVKQRERIRDDTFEFLFDMFNIAVSDRKTYKGYKLLAVDGSELDSFYDNKDIDKLEENESSLYHLNVAYDLLSKTYTHAILQSKGEIDERKALVEMLKNTNPTEKRLYICDRGYPSWNVFTHFKYTENTDFLIRYPNNGSTLTSNLPNATFDIMQNIVVTNTKLYNSRRFLSQDYYAYVSPNVQWDFGKKERLKLRIIRFEWMPGEYETLVTSLSKEEFPFEEIKKLYKMRWGVETSFKNLKYPMGVNQLPNRRKGFVKQDIFARLTMYNFYQRIMNEIEVIQNERKKCKYQINFAMSSHICRDYFLDRISDDAVVVLIPKYSYPAIEVEGEKMIDICEEENLENVNDSFENLNENFGSGLRK